MRRQAYHVHVAWPGNRRPWLILIEGTSEADVRRAIAKDVRAGNGKIISVKRQRS